MIRWLEDIWTSIRDQPVSEPYDDQWQEDRKWFKEEFRPFTGVNYTELRDYAQRQHDIVSDANRAIDTKAEWLFGIGLAAIAGFLSASGTFGLPSFAGYLATIPCLLCLSIALRTRLPMASPFSITAREAIRFDEHGVISNAWIAASLHCATEGERRVNRWKSSHLRDAARCLILSVGVFLSLLLIPLVLRVAEVPVQHEKSAQESQDRQEAESASASASRWEWDWRVVVPRQVESSAPQ